MPAITALVAQLKRRDRTNVFVDGEFALGLSNTLAAELRVGQEPPRRTSPASRPATPWSRLTIER